MTGDKGLESAEQTAERNVEVINNDKALIEMMMGASDEDEPSQEDN